MMHTQAKTSRITWVTCVQALLELHLVAQQHEDTHASTYIQTSFLNPQVTLPLAPHTLMIVSLTPFSLSACLSLYLPLRPCVFPRH